MKWGEKSVIKDLAPTFYNGVNGVQGRETRQVISFGQIFETEDCDLIRYFLSQWKLTEAELSDCLTVAISQNEHSKIQLFLDYHGFVSLQRLLETQAGSGLATLHTLLPYLSANPSAAALLFGAQALLKAIRIKPTIQQQFGTAGMRHETDQDSLEGWDQLLSSGMIDLGGKVEWNGIRFVLSPLGAAIKRHGKSKDPDFMMILKLLNAGCLVNTIAKYAEFGSGIICWTVLLLAIETEDEELVQLLIDHGADVHEAPSLAVKRTPLQQAAEVGSLEIVKLLLRHDVDVNAAPSARSGGTALQFAAISGNCNIAAELLSRGALLYAPPSKVNGRWPIEGAAEHGRLTMIEYLWMAKENTSFPDNVETGFEEVHCRRAMELAERNGHIACRDFIAEIWGLLG